MTLLLIPPSAWRPGLLALVMAACTLAAPPAAARWELVDLGACENVSIHFSEDFYPEPEKCTPAMAGKAALCFTEVCRPHCYYFNHPVEQCQPGADLGKRYVCVPD